MTVAQCYRNASEVRKNWSSTIDSVVRERPAFINRTHDSVAIIDANLLRELLKDYKYHVIVESEDDGSVTGFVDELQLAENAPNKQELINTMISSMKDYAIDYYTEFGYWSKASNRMSHIPYVLKLLISDDEKIAGDIICQSGKS